MECRGATARRRAQVRTFLRGLSAVTITNVSNGLLSVMIVPIAVKRLGIEGYGLYSIFSVLAGYLVLIELGIGKNLVRVLGGARLDSDTRETLRLAIGVYVVIAGALILLSPALAVVVKVVLFRVPAQFSDQLHWIFAIAILDYLLGIPVSVRLNHALSLERMEPYARFMLLSHTSRHALLLIGVLYTSRPESVVGFALGRRFVDLVTSPLLLPTLPSGSWRPRFDLGEARQLIGQSSLLALSQLLQLSTVVAGSVLVNGFLGLVALGAYRSTFDIVSKAWFFSNTAGTVIFPRLIQILRSRSAAERLGRVLPGVQSASWIFCSCIAVVGSIAAPSMLRLLGLGETPPLLFSLLLVGVLWNSHSVMSIEVLQAGGRFRTVAGTAVVSLGSMTMSFLLLTPHEPVLAIGWAWVLSQLITSSITDVEALGHLKGGRTLGGTASARLSGALLAAGGIAWAGGLGVFSASVTVAGLLLSIRNFPTIAASIRELGGRRSELSQLA